MPPPARSPAGFEGFAGQLPAQIQIRCVHLQSIYRHPPTKNRIPFSKRRPTEQNAGATAAPPRARSRGWKGASLRARRHGEPKRLRWQASPRSVRDFRLAGGGGQRTARPTCHSPFASSRLGAFALKPPAIVLNQATSRHPPKTYESIKWATGRSLWGAGACSRLREPCHLRKRCRRSALPPQSKALGNKTVRRRLQPLPVTSRRRHSFISFISFISSLEKAL